MKPTQLSRLAFFQGGYCRQLRWLADGKGWGTRRFHALFLAFHHPTEGTCLIDTGYSHHFKEATDSFPERFYRWMTPATLNPAGDASQILTTHGWDPPGKIFLSHFHADHIGGARCFPKARFVYLGEGIDELSDLPVFSQVRHGFLSHLLPEGFNARAIALGRDLFHRGKEDWREFDMLDYFGDQSLWLVHLPGHAPGHLGFVLNVDPKPVFYITDACWNLDQLRSQKPLPVPSRKIQHSYPDYLATQDKIRRIDPSRLQLAACHCPFTETLAANHAD